MIVRSPTGSALLVHFRAEVMHRSYPILGDTLRRIQYLTTQMSIADLANVILQDQGFTAIVLHAANKLNAGPRPITSITRGILIVGYNAVRDLAIAAEVVDVTEKRLPKSIHLKHLLTKAVLAAHHTDQFRFAQSLPDSEEGFTRALLHTIDELTLALHAPDLYARIQALVFSRGTSYEEAHVQVTGLSPSQVIKVFCELNGLPTEFFTVPLDWHQPETWTAEQRLHGTIHLANAFARNRLAPSSSETTQAYDALVTQTGQALNLPQPVITTCLKTAWSTLLKRSPEMPLIRADPPDAERARALLEEAASPQSVPAVQQLILELTQHVNEVPDFNTIISFILEIMQRGLGFTHAFLIIPTSNGQQLIARCGLGEQVQGLLPTFTTPLDTETSLLALILQRRGMHLLSRDDLTPGPLPRRALAAIRPACVAIGTLLTPTHPVGLIWADSVEPVNGERWFHFQRVIRLANLGLAELVTAVDKKAPTQKSEPKDMSGCETDLSVGPEASGMT
ncbi:MAG: HDOD domain-containing protein [Nitrospirales bacterium]